MCPEFTVRVVWTAAVLGLAASTSHGDQVVAGGANYPGAIVVGMDDGKLEFRTAAGTLETAWLSDVDLVIIDRGGLFADINQGERYLEGREPDKAIDRYKRALKLSEDFWSDFITARMLVACNRAGRLDQGVRNFISVAEGEASGPALAARLMPDAFPPRQSKATVRAVEELDAAIARGDDNDVLALLRLLRYEILLQTGDQRAKGAERAIATMKIPSFARTATIYAIKLTALEGALTESADRAVWSSLDQAIAQCPEKMLAGFLLLKGRALLDAAATREEIIRATWPLMRIVIHMPDDQRAPEALYATSLALERIGRQDRAVSLLQECLAHKRLGAQTGERARTALERLKSTAASPR